MRIRKMLEKLLSIPKSIYVCLRLFPFKDAVKLPMYVRYNCRLYSLKGRIQIDAPKVYRGMCKVGFAVVGIFDKRHSPAILKINGKLTLKGKATFGQGSKICIGPGGHLTIGEGYINTAEGAILCYDSITIGKDVSVSWNTTIMDTDFHPIQDLSTNKQSKITGEISIGDHVCIGMGSTLLKNTTVPDGCIIGARTLVNKKFTEPNVLIAGNPGMVKKRNVSKGIEVQAS